MYKRRSDGFVHTANKLESVYVETDSSGRYGRFRDILGKGAMKTVYKAFDTVLGMEVAWNQAKLGDAFHSPVDLQRLYSEVHLLKNLKHDSVMRFYAFWIDINSGNFNFITELFTSGTLGEYTQKYQSLNIEAVKNWARQILHGLAYLHSHDPPVIHRDLKCANIFVNGHLGQVKIGDFGLAAVLQGSPHAHSVIGTPEFMAPEIYEEEYNELVDIYSFGMCMIEMLTSEYPYSECSNPAQIYKKVTSGKLPAAFYRIHHWEARKFVGKCLEKVSERLPAKSLLLHPFLASDQLDLTPPRPNLHSRESFYGVTLSKDHHSQTYQIQSTNMTITGTMNNEDDTIFLKVQTADKNGHTRNIYFPFDIANDTAMEVSMEMVKELDISDWELLVIAEMIEEEISTLVPTWKDLRTSQFNKQSFIYEDDYDDGNHSESLSPFSQSSNQGSPKSLVGPSRLCGNSNGVYECIQDNGFDGDDTSSQSSMNSMKYSQMNYYDSSMEEGCDKRASSSENNLCCIPETKKYTRLCPVEESKANQNHDPGLTCWQHLCCNQQRKLTRRSSYIDIRSQLLHRSLMQKINKGRLFKTVGAVENIGFQEPA